MHEFCCLSTVNPATPRKEEEIKEEEEEEEARVGKYLTGMTRKVERDKDDNKTN